VLQLKTTLERAHNGHSAGAGKERSRDEALGEAAEALAASEQRVEARLHPVAQAPHRPVDVEHEEFADDE
jgi:hypothetical protein